ncbi:conserved hypothetical protein [Theileria equi strain WA]|uniref:Signal peptide-containing protein n=1 Tax=Theileria equi strain WA TaxID=1537102 RepID=L1LET0_THEEQ|nr:conserved hypothetical protein [Theileria equi strain WA]EKX73745.1 conserved hypothetical protein [Theileria equi strain WA]|eukprot:XP_004833197.1 conserved hypothetical protein [Theileria equi strain WA]
MMLCGTYILYLLDILFLLAYTTDGNIANLKINGGHYSILTPGLTQARMDDGMICKTAKCSHKTNTVFSVPNVICGNHYVCQSCPISSGGNICYLGGTNGTSVTVVEGEVYVTDKQSKNVTPDAKSDSEDKEDDDDYDPSFVERNVEVMSMAFKEHSSTIFSKKRMCKINTDGSIPVSVTLFLQWYIDPLSAHNNSSNHDDIDPLSMLELNGKDTEDYEDDDYDESMTGRLTSIYSITKGLMNKAKHVHKALGPKFTRPRVNIHFVVDNIEISQCRYPQLWKGKLNGKSLIFIGTQNFSIRPKDFNIDFFRKSIKVHVTTKSYKNLKFNSCVQVNCTKGTDSLQNLAYNHNTLVNIPHHISQNPPQMHLNLNFVPQAHGYAGRFRSYGAVHNFNYIPAVARYSTSGIICVASLLLIVTIQGII